MSDESRTTRRWVRRWVLLALALACLAPTPGDIGGCGQTLEDLDARAFFAAKREVDCDACRECGFRAETCERSCDREEPLADAFETGCFPFVHDGEVCLRALRHSTCEEYEAFISDVNPSVPSECDFCPRGLRP